MMNVTEAVVHTHLASFLELNLPKTGNAVLGVSDRNFAGMELLFFLLFCLGAIKAEVGCECVSDEFVAEVTRALRAHSENMLKGFKEGGLSWSLLTYPKDIGRAQLGLGHAYSRAKVKFNVNRADNMIIQAICLLDQLDKDVNTFSMRCKEWYGWHFPELVKILPESGIYAKAVQYIKDKSLLSEGLFKVCLYYRSFGYA
jgi:nucleolar protein 56